VATWTEEADAAGRELCPRILGHPFLRELRDGILPDHKLRYYAGQRRHYADAAVKACALAAAKAPDGETRDFCLDCSGGIDEWPRADDGHVVRAEAGVDIAPTCRGYALHVLTIAYSRDAVDLLAAFLPHRWSRAETGALFDGRRDDLPRGEERRSAPAAGREDLLARHRAIVDRLAAELPPGRRAQLLDDYVLSLRYELRFWDMAYTGERWPSDAALPA
jgi:thiaminase (transcriptional activator TenA)